MEFSTYNCFGFSGGLQTSPSPVDNFGLFFGVELKPVPGCPLHVHSRLSHEKSQWLLSALSSHSKRAQWRSGYGKYRN